MFITLLHSRRFPLAVTGGGAPAPLIWDLENNITTLREMMDGYCRVEAFHMPLTPC